MHPTARFAGVFIIAFAILLGGFEASRGTSFERFVVENLILAPTVRLDNAVLPSDHIELSGRTLVSGASRLHVVRGCEGVEMFLLLTAAIIAFPARLECRLQGLLIGFLVAYVLSVLRLSALVYTLRHAPKAWESLHGLLLPLAPVLIIGWYFLRWTAWSAGKRSLAEEPQAA